MGDAADLTRIMTTYSVPGGEMRRAESAAADRREHEMRADEESV